MVIIKFCQSDCGSVEHWEVLTSEDVKKKYYDNHTIVWMYGSKSD